MKKELFVIEAAHDWATIFSCSKCKIYSIDLKSDDFSKEGTAWLNELISIEKMSFDEFSTMYDNPEPDTFFVEEMIEKSKVKP